MLSPYEPVVNATISFLRLLGVKANNNSPGRRKPIILEKDDFLKKWNGVYLIAEPTMGAGEKNYKQVRLKLFFRSLVPFLFLLLLTGCSFYGLQITMRIGGANR